MEKYIGIFVWLIFSEFFIHEILDRFKLLASGPFWVSRHENLEKKFMNKKFPL